MSFRGLTKLDAINSALTSAGGSPISSLTGSLSKDAAVALIVFDEVDREVQARGWHWNTDTDVVIMPDTNGFLLVPADALHVDSLTFSATSDVVIRGDRLFDRGRNTDVFNGDLHCVVVRRLDFESIPSAARDYISARVSRELQMRVLSDPQKDAYLASRVRDAWAGLLIEDLNSSDQRDVDNDLGQRAFRSTPWFRSGGRT